MIEIGQGAWEGRLRTEIEANDGELLAAWRQRPLEANAPGGERVVDAAERARSALVDTLAGLVLATPTDRSSAGSWAPVPGYPAPGLSDAPWSLLVGHDGIFKLAVLALLDVPIERFWSFPFALCGITIVELRNGRGVLRAHNLADHLAAVSVLPTSDPVSGGL